MLLQTGFDKIRICRNEMINTGLYSKNQKKTHPQGWVSAFFRYYPASVNLIGMLN